MSNQTNTERLQYDKDGQLVGKVIRSPLGLALLLEPGFIYVETEEGETRVWGGKNRELIEFAKCES